MSAPIRVRASSLSGLFDCASRWEAVNLLGMRSKTSIRAALGTAVHASTALFDKSRLEGTGITIEESAAALVDSLKQQIPEMLADDDDLLPATAEKIGLKLHARYCAEISPRFDFVAVEMETQPLEIDCGGGVSILLTGTLDRARVYRPAAQEGHDLSDGPGVGISDLKTGKTAVSKGVANTKKHALQIGVYELLTEHSAGVQVNRPAEIIGMNTSGSPEIATGRIEGARRILLGDENNLGMLDHAAAIFRAGLFTPNPSSVLCSQKYCPRYNTCPAHA